MSLAPLLTHLSIGCGIHYFPSLLLACAPVLAQTELPLEFAIHVPISSLAVEGRPAGMILDTGASITVLDAAFAESLPLAGAKRANIAGAGQTAQALAVNHLRVALPNRQAAEVPAVILPLETLSRQAGRRIDGVLGAHFLRRHIVEFDYHAGRAHFHPPGGFTPPPGWSALPLRLEEGRPAVEGILVGEGTKHYPGEFVLDTGSNYAVTLLPKFAERHGLPGKAVPTLDDPALGVAGASPAVVFLSRAFRVGEFHFASPYVRVRQRGSGKASGLIGGALLRQLRFAIDYPGNRLYLARGVEFAEPLAMDLAGLRIAWEGSDFSQARVVEVFPGRAAAKAGIRPGDELDMAGLGPNEFAARVRKPKSSLPLTVRRGGQSIAVELQLEPLLAVRP